MKTFLFRSMIGIFFGAFLAVVVTNSIVYFGGESMIDGSLFLKNSLRVDILWLVLYCHTALL